jgi:hypothetical protein
MMNGGAEEKIFGTLENDDRKAGFMGVMQNLGKKNAVAAEIQTL